MVHSRGLAFAAVLWLTGCKKAGAPVGDDTPFTPESPQAKAIPAPLASSPTSAGGSHALAPLGADAGSAPVPMRADSPIPIDNAGKETGLTTSMTMALRIGDPTGPSKGPDVHLAAIETMRKLIEPLLVIDIGTNRARFMIGGRGFPLPEGTEIRARADRYGHIVLWPEGRTYRIVAPGSLRSLFQERRFDVSSFSPVQMAPPTEGPKRFGVRTRRVELTTRIARVSIDLGRIEGLGEGGALVCRMIAELINAWPALSFSLPDEVPLHADLIWNTGGSVAFDALTFPHRTEIPVQALAVPPATARFSETMPPALPGEMILTEKEFGVFRLAAGDPMLPPRNDSLALTNATDQLRFAWLDGVPAAWIAPGKRLMLTGLATSQYALQWRTFLGADSKAPETVEVPGAASIGTTN